MLRRLIRRGLILGLAASFLPATAFAQKASTTSSSSGGGGRSTGMSGGCSTAPGCHGSFNPCFPGNGYTPFGNGYTPFGNGYTPFGNGIGNGCNNWGSGGFCGGSGIFCGGGGGYSYSYIVQQPIYVYQSPPDASQLPPPTQTLPQPNPLVAFIDLNVPEDADLWVQGVKMTQVGGHRRFVTPNLAAGVDYAYELKIVYKENGKDVTVVRQMSVRAGDRKSLTIIAQPAEIAQAK